MFRRTNLYLRIVNSLYTTCHVRLRVSFGEIRAYPSSPEGHSRNKKERLFLKNISPLSLLPPSSLYSALSSLPGSPAVSFHSFCVVRAAPKRYFHRAAFHAPTTATLRRRRRSRSRFATGQSPQKPYTFGRWKPRKIRREKSRCRHSARTCDSGFSSCNEWGRSRGCKAQSGRPIFRAAGSEPGDSN